MRKSYISALTLAVAQLVTVGATANGLSLRDKAALQFDGFTINKSFKAEPLLQKAYSAGPQVTPGYMAIVKLAPGATLDDLAGQEGVTVLGGRFNFGYISVTADQVERVASLPAVKRFQLSRKVNMKMDRARLVTGIDKIHQGVGLDRAYTGKGVVAGVVDTGVDPNHINFKNPDGSSRVSLLSWTYANQLTESFEQNLFGSPELLTDEVLKEFYYFNGKTGLVEEFKTDDIYNYHGTHTLGTMVGSYNGNGKYADLVGTAPDFKLNMYEDAPIPYYGVATGADIAAGAGANYDGQIAMNVDAIALYAAMTDQRAVINLSLGSSQGPHDGSMTLNEVLDIYSLENYVYTDDKGETHSEPSYNVIMCLSAGNEGDLPIAVHKTVAPGDMAGTFIIPLIENGLDDDGNEYINPRFSTVEIWSDDATPFKLSIVIYSKSRDKIAATVVSCDDVTESLNVATTTDYSDYGTENTMLTKYFEGLVAVGAALDENSNRYYGLAQIQTLDNANNKDNYLLGIKVEPLDGDTKSHRYDFYHDADNYAGFSSYGIEGWLDCDGDGTISDMATGFNQIIVGSWNTRESWACLDGSAYSNGEGECPEGEVSKFTAWGVLPDGRELPHVVAPGAVVVSSSNRWMHESKGNEIMLDPSNISATATVDGVTNYYMQMSGTSMATPLVAGSIALWLEADPTLTFEDVRDIIKKTAVRDAAVEAAGVQAGAGKFDAYAGLKEVLRRASGMTDVAAPDDEASRLLLNLVGERTLNVMLPGAKGLDVTLYTTLGAKVGTTASATDETDLDLSGLAPGVYVVNANGTHSAKITVK